MSRAEHQLDGDVRPSTVFIPDVREPLLIQNVVDRSKLIPTLFMRYNLELGDPDAEWTTKCWFFVMQRGLGVRLSKRHSA